MGTRVAAVKPEVQHIKRFRNPHTGMMEDNLFGAKWSLGVVSAVNEVQVMAGQYDRSSALAVAHANQHKKTRRGRKYTVAFDDGSSEVDIPVDRIRSEAAAVVSPEAVVVRTGE